MSLSVKETVRRCLIQYPSLFRNKGDVYDHLFLTIGNGYEWVDGGLVEKSSGDDQPQWADESGDGPANEHPEITAMMRPGRILDARRENNQIRFVLDNFDALFDEPLVLWQPYSDACEYSRLFTMPDDVRDDWRKACNDTSLALASWIHRHEHSLPAIPKMKELNVEFRRKHFIEQDRRVSKILGQERDKK